MKYTNKLNLPEAIVQAVANDEYNSGESDITVTQLISPVQQVRLQIKYRDQLVEDISDNIYALIGKAVHYILERSENTAKVEERIFAEVNGWKLSGQFDRLALITENGGFTGLLQDYKLSSVWEYIFGLKPEREAQLNCLVWLLRQKGIPVSKLQIVMIFRDWQISKAMYDKNYPQQQVGIMNVPLWSVERQQQYIENRIKIFQSDVIPECTAEERWNKGDKYAVYKLGNKTAYKVCDSREEAEQWMIDNEKGDKIEVRPGENKRCDSYCNVSAFCPQYQAMKAKINAA